VLNFLPNGSLNPLRLKRGNPGLMNNTHNNQQQQDDHHP
jgi:hypothetical protein